MRLCQRDVEFDFSNKRTSNLVILLFTLHRFFDTRITAKSKHNFPTNKNFFRKPNSTLTEHTRPIAGFHSRDQQPCFSTKTKGSDCIIIEINSRRIWSGHQHGRPCFV